MVCRLATGKKEPDKCGQGIYTLQLHYSINVGITMHRTFWSIQRTI